MKVRALALLLSFALIAPRAASPADCFSEQIAEAEKGLKQGVSERLDDDVAVVWFPKTDNVFTTTNIEAHGVIWGTMDGYSVKGPVDAFTRLMNQKKKGYFRFSIRASREEADALSKALSDPAFHGKSCVKGACLALKDAGIMRIPFPFDRSPILNAVYLGLVKSFPGSRVKSVAYVGKSPFKTILGSTDFWAEGLVTGMVGAVGGVAVGITTYLVVLIVNDKGEEEKVVVPITTPPGPTSK